MAINKRLMSKYLYFQKPLFCSGYSSAGLARQGREGSERDCKAHGSSSVSAYVLGDEEEEFLFPGVWQEIVQWLCHPCDRESSV